MGCVTPISLKKSFQSVNRITRALAKNCNDSSHLLDPTIVFATLAFFLPIPGLVVGLQLEISKIACLIQKLLIFYQKYSLTLSRSRRLENNCSTK